MIDILLMRKLIKPLYRLGTSLFFIILIAMVLTVLFIILGNDFPSSLDQTDMFILSLGILGGLVIANLNIFLKKIIRITKFLI